MSRITVVALLALVAGALPMSAQAQEEAPKKDEAPKQEAAPKKMKTRTEVITRQEVEEMAQGAGDAEQVVKRLRPKWLSPRAYTGSPSAGMLQAQEVQVYLDEIHQGGAAIALRRISVDLIGEMRYLTGSEAGARYGLNNQSGAILVTSRGKVRP